MSGLYAGAYQVVTDDRGVYRAYGLPPGDYIVRATGGGAFFGTLRLTTSAEIDTATREMAAGGSKPPPPVLPTPPAPPVAAPQLARAMSYHPGVAEMVSAQTVTVGVGEDRGGIDVVSRRGAGWRVPPAWRCLPPGSRCRT